MNALAHIESVQYSFVTDARILPRHISLYMALYFVWGRLKFMNPVQVVRHEIMPLSKIGSVNTFIKTIKELDKWGYISYSPSKSAYKSSTVTITIFDNRDDNNTHNTTDNTSVISADKRRDASTDITDDNGSGKGSDNNTDKSSDMRDDHSVDNLADESEDKTVDSSDDKTTGNSTANSKSDNSTPINKLLNNNYKSLLDNNKELLNNHIGGRAREEQAEVLALEKTKADEKKKKRFVKPTLKQLEDYFKQKQADMNQAQRFFNHFESNGWRVGGKSPMKDWKAAARNWILNISRYSSNKEKKEDTTNYLSTKNDKDYGEPL